MSGFTRQTLLCWKCALMPGEMDAADFVRCIVKSPVEKCQFKVIAFVINAGPHME